MSEKYVVVIGALNLDLAGLSGGVYRASDSNIGKIEITVGGVGYNIAQNLQQLSVPTHLITVYGDDFFGKFLVETCKDKGICLEHSECIPNGKSSTYLYIANDKGEMISAINDMSITDLMTPEFFEKRIVFINNAAICVIDANIPQESIEWLAKHCSVPIFVDPVSMSKISRFETVLDKIDTMKPNELEAEFLSGIKIVDKESERHSVEVLHKKGIKNIFLSKGAHGILCSRFGEKVQVDIIPTQIKSVNGAGDCAMATLVWGRYFNKDSSLRSIGQYSQAAASITLESYESVSPELNVKKLENRVNMYYCEEVKCKKQIYSLMNYNESIATIEAGADHIGLVPMQSGGVVAHRVPFDVVDRIFDEAKRRGVKCVAIMLNKDVEEIIFITKRVKPDIVHIAGMEFTADEAFAKRLKSECPWVELMQAVLVDGVGAVERAKYFATFCDYILTDSGLAPDTGIGASGLTHDWSIDAEIVRSVNIPVIIAGGLGPENVEECIKQIKPFGVDSLTKTSYKYSDGIMEKDILKVKEFCDRADKAAMEIGLV